MGGQTVQRLGNGLVGQLQSLVDGLALDHLGGHGGRRDGGAAAKGLKLHVLDDIVFNFQINLHDVAALGVADLAHAVGALDGAHVPGVHEVIHNFFAVQCHFYYRSLKINLVFSVKCGEWSVE